jgi:hypothetical protein
MKKVVVVLSMSILFACGGDDDSDTVDAAPAIDAEVSEPDAAVAADQCYPDGIYGKCSESQCPFCLQGATIYEVCSESCTSTAQCGDPADFDGAQPLCAPLNPNAMEMICVLTCTAQEQCPCGLECRASGVQGVNICAETL